MKRKLLQLFWMGSFYSFSAMLIQCIFFNAALAVNSSAQIKSVKEVYIEVEFNNTTLARVFQDLESKTNFKFVYDKKDKFLGNVFTLKNQNITVEKLLLKISQEANLSFKQVNLNISVLQNGAKDSSVIEVIIQARNITGRVTSREDGESLPGVSVIELGTNNGTVTDLDGRYSLQVSEGAVLVYSSVGYTREEVEIGNRSVIDLVMIQDIKQLEELVVVGYGTQKKINLTGSVDVVSSEQLSNRSASNMSFLLQGTAPNLHFSIDPQGGGEPGSSGTWKIRGMGSIRGNDRPLVLVDGVEMNMNDLNPEDVESVTILKDASASAVYGARAPFGVVLITTKKGKAGRPVIKFGSNFTVKDWHMRHDQVDALTWVTAYNQASTNAGSAPLYPESQIERIRGHIDGTFPYEYDPENPISGLWAGRRHGNANYSWPRELFKPYSMQQKHDVSLSGGDDKTQYYVSLGIFDEDGMYRYGYDLHRRYNVLANLSTQATDWLKFSINTRYAVTETDYPEGQTNDRRIRVIQEAATFSPMMPKYNINGTIQSPLIALLDGAGRNVTERNDMWLTLRADIEPIRRWITSISYNYNKYTQAFDGTPHPVWVEDGYGVMNNIGRPYTAYIREIDNDRYRMFNAVSTYDVSIGSHNMRLMAGYEQEYKHLTFLEARGDDLITQSVPSLSTALGQLQINDRMSHWATQGIFGRFNYVYADKYLLELSARNQGSSRFAPGKRWGFFPSGSVGYVISNENFWSPVEPYIEMLKFRGSYGSLGNQNVSNYLYLSRIPVSADHLWIIDDALPVAASVPALISDNLTWETITSLNLGFDASFLDDRLELVFDWFERKTMNMIGPSVALPTLLGTGVPQSNNAELMTKGFELSVGWRSRVSNTFSYNAKLTLGDNKTTILKYQNPEFLIDSWYNGKVAGEIWGYSTDRIIQTDEDLASMPDQSFIHTRWNHGDIMYKDLTGDGKINVGQRTLNNHGDLTIIGNSTPRYNTGIIGGVNWKNFDFRMFWQGVLRRQYYPSTGSTLVWGMINGFGSSGLIKKTDHLNYWRPANETNLLGPNTDAYFPKPYFSNETNKNRQPQSRYLQNAAYLRFKNLQIGYNIPMNILSSAKIQNARIYFTGENLFTIKSLPPLLDPETIVASEPSFGGYRSGIVYPLPRTFAVGVNLTF
jgi:TonB-linked SusC/RagA family outer membrane protein